MNKLLLLFLFSSTCCLAEGNFFKWTDEKGVIHYSETKSEENNSSEITVQTTKVTSANSYSNLEEKSDRKKETTYRLKKYAEQDHFRRQKEKARKKRCRKAKQSMKDLKRSFNKRTTHPKTGGYIYPTYREEARMKAYQQEAIRKKQIYVTNACKREKN